MEIITNLVAFSQCLNFKDIIYEFLNGKYFLEMGRLENSPYTCASLVSNRRTMCHRRPRNSDILSKVALLLVLLPHMAQTQYARGKPDLTIFSIFLEFVTLTYMGTYPAQFVCPLGKYAWGGTGASLRLKFS